MSELLGKELEIEGVGNNKIPYLGYTVLSFNLGHVDKDGSIDVPFLVSEGKLRQPLIGSNVIQELAIGASGADMQKLLQSGLQGYDVATVTAISKKLLGHTSLATVKTLKKKVRLKVLAGATSVLRCKIDSVDVKEATQALFQPRLDWNWDQTEVKLLESVIYLHQGSNTKIRINVVNLSDKDYIFDEAEVLGTLEEIQAVAPAEVMFRRNDEMKQTKVEASSIKANLQSDYAFPNGSFADVKLEDLSEEDRAFYSMVGAMQFHELEEKEKTAMKDMLWQERKAFSRSPDDIGSAPELQLSL